MNKLCSVCFDVEADEMGFRRAAGRCINHVLNLVHLWGIENRGATRGWMSFKCPGRGDHDFAYIMLSSNNSGVPTIHEWEKTVFAC